MDDKFPAFLPVLAAVPFSLGNSGGSIMWLSIIAILLFAVELIFFLIPGISLSSLMIAIAAIEIGFVPTLVVSIIAIEAAHFILRKDISMFVPDILTLVPLIGFGAFYGTWMIGAFGWGIYGLSFGLIKWGIAIPVGLVTGRNMGKRVRELVLEPPLNFLIFLKLNFIFLFLF
jgi:hypothetical protein